MTLILLIVQRIPNTAFPLLMFWCLYRCRDSRNFKSEHSFHKCTQPNVINSMHCHRSTLQTVAVPFSLHVHSTRREHFGDLLLWIIFCVLFVFMCEISRVLSLHSPHVWGGLKFLRLSSSYLDRPDSSVVLLRWNQQEASLIKQYLDVTIVCWSHQFCSRCTLFTKAEEIVLLIDAKWGRNNQDYRCGFSVDSLQDEFQRK